MSQTDWYRSALVAPGTWAIDDHGADTMFLLTGTGPESPTRALLIDTGFGFGALAGAVQSLLGLPDLTSLQVVNSHGHPDHALGNWQFPRVYVGAADLVGVDQPLAPEQRTGMMEHVLPSDPAERDALRRAGIPPAEWGTRVPEEIVAIGDGYIFDLDGRTLEVIAVPGHTPGSICLLDRGQRLLFAGDAIHNSTVWMHLDHCTTLTEYQRSLQRLMGWRDAFDRMFWGHSMEPAPAHIVEDMIAGIDRILSGECVGREEHTFAGDGLRCDLSSCSLIYRPDRL